MKNTIKNAGCGQIVHYQCVKNCALIPSLLFLVIVCFPVFSYAASFDCAKASTNVEKLICSDKKLGFYDEKLNRVYKDLRAISKDKDALRKEQLAWLKDIRNKCDAKLCLSEVYEKRIELLKGELRKARYEHGPKNKLEYYLSLANDDDPVTGVWADYGDAAMSFYTLYEKVNGQYKATYCSPRYTVTTWPGRVEVSDNKISVWNYKIVDETIRLEESNSLTYFVQDNELLKDHETGNPVSMLFASEENIREMATCTFGTGQSYVEDSLQTLIENSSQTDIYSILSESQTLRQHGNINSISEIAALEKGGYKFYLFQISLGFPSRSGYCGSSEDRGYYWLKVSGSDIEDEWLLTDNDCRSSAYVSFDQENYLFTTGSITGRSDRMLACFIVVEKAINNKPQPCDKKNLKSILSEKKYALYVSKVDFFDKYITREDIIKNDYKYVYDKTQVKQNTSNVTFALLGMKEKERYKIIPLEVMPERIRKIVIKRSKLQGSKSWYLLHKKPEDMLELDYLIQWINAWHEGHGSGEEGSSGVGVVPNDSQIFDPKLPTLY